ncbi:MAG: type IV secretion system protein [Gammaproteobacteria bacterium]|nr:type IV secretion system protein [Gammaproteobacteria bacterium]
MNLKLFFKPIKTRIEPSLNKLDERITSKKTSKALENPYVYGALGREEWNDRYFNMARAIKQWQIAFYAMLVLVAIFAFLMVREANKVKVEPFVVEMSEGMPVAIKDMSEGDPNDSRIILFALEQFIVNARSVLGDDTAEKAMLAKTYSYASDKAVTFLNEYYKENDPFDIAANYTTSVDIVNTLKVGDNTYQITWDETERDNTNGGVINKTRWIGEVTYRMGDVDKRFVKDNPFGLYVSQLSWSQNKV